MNLYLEGWINFWVECVIVEIYINVRCMFVFFLFNSFLFLIPKNHVDEAYIKQIENLYFLSIF